MIDHDALQIGLPDDEDAPVVLRRPMTDTVEMDITPMIDIVFLLLIFFLVCATQAAQTGVPLPPAKHGKGVSEQTAVVLTVAEAEGSKHARVFLGDGISGPKLPDDPDQLEAAIVREVEKGYGQGKTHVMVKAGKEVKHGDVARVTQAVGAADVEGKKLHMAVLEVD
jgi:biopolymer transport protein ExbD